MRRKQDLKIKKPREAEIRKQVKEYVQRGCSIGDRYRCHYQYGAASERRYAGDYAHLQFR